MITRNLSLRDSFGITLRGVLRIGLFVFLLGISSRARVYLPYSPVPVTLQTLVVFLSVVFLGRGALYSQALYIILGISGLPLFSRGAGLVYLAGPTGGYILGFLLASVILINILPLRRSVFWYCLSFCLADLIILTMGALWITVVLRVSLGEAVSIGILPFIYGDSLKIVLATLVARMAKQTQDHRLRDDG